MRKIACMLLLLVASIGSMGCELEKNPVYREELHRYIYMDQVGPFHAAVTVGLASPLTGGFGFSTIAADYGLRSAYSHLGEGMMPPSPWDIPDSERGCKIENVGRYSYVAK